jgi:lipopolysaccharide biosynthesis glycosyltransferase
MVSEHVDHAFVGCATDHGFVGPTCAMLSSLDDNSELHDATVIVADFGLDREDRGLIRTAAGHFGERMEFLPLNRASREIVAVPQYRFPLPLIGRLVVPREIKESNARLLMLDSDMVINRSLRPLFEINMRGFPLAAVHDSIASREHYGRARDDHYFNAGMMLIDVDRFNADDIGGEAMRVLASFDPPPMWLDQDALNQVCRNKWLGLDRRWNFFHAGDQRTFTLEDYQRADVVHFSGEKPWNGHPHPAKPIWDYHVRRAREKTVPDNQVMGTRVNRVFATACYEVLLGRQAENVDVLRGRDHLKCVEFIQSLLMSSEFAEFVLRPLTENTSFQAGRFCGEPSLNHRFFAADRLPVYKYTKRAVEHASSWRLLLRALLADRNFMSLGERQPIAIGA